MNKAGGTESEAGRGKVWLGEAVSTICLWHDSFKNPADGERESSNRADTV